MNSSTTVLGVRFDLVSFDQALKIIGSPSGTPLFCVTPNPEICLEALKNPPFKKVLLESHLSVADGFGILWAARYLKGKRTFLRWIYTLSTPWKTKTQSPLPERVTGTDLLKKYCEVYKHKKIFLLGASETVNERLATLLKNQGSNIVGHYSGSPSENEEEEICKRIHDSKAETVFVAFGAPKQELWIHRNFHQLTQVKVFMGIGGAFDFLAGERRRAPSWMRKIGIEWLFRLAIEPKRWRRIWNATVVFPWKVYRNAQQ